MWNDATILKERLLNVIQVCVDDYRTRVLGLTMQETWESEWNTWTDAALRDSVLSPINTRGLDLPIRPS